MVDSFSKYMWTVPLKVKSASAVVPAIRTIFMTFGPIFLLHSDNGREFCNELMTLMLEEFQVRHVRGRARCPRIQGQVERANQTIKWMFGSRLLSLNTPGKWTNVRESATHSYNHMRHGTTSNIPFVLFFGPSIRDLMQEDYLIMVIEDPICEINEVEEENIVFVEPVDILDIGNFEFLDQERIEDVNLPIDIKHNS
ncbi:Pro-Pol polyprotein [Nosema granulosis]|uniref:Pro-Pol polyprotein n=1 Tax=Nosema granulosis TaxID=83296 RepID=A0A9P6GX89_9MICR|nr:Pro-Pol polyprotein [Nosema granulosis]